MSKADSSTDQGCYGLEQLVDDPGAEVAALREIVPPDDEIGQRREIFKALANENRIRILAVLREGERCVCELQAALDAPQSTVATHLRKLKDAGLVTSRKKGTWRLYRVTDTATFELLDTAGAMGGND